MCHRGSFRDDIYKKCILCKDADNGLIHVVNECAKLANERKQLLKDLNSINKRKDTELLKAIEFHYYSKSYTNKKAENKDDNKRYYKLSKGKHKIAAYTYKFRVLFPLSFIRYIIFRR